MLDETKARVRRDISAILAGTNAKQLQAASARLVEHLRAWLPPQAGIVALFAPLRDEPDLRPLHDQQRDLTLLYPRVNGDTLAFHEVSDPDELLYGTFGIREPDPDRHALHTLNAIDIFLCPGLAFARDGGRLGRGKGFYDRVLTQARPDACRVGAAFACQIFPILPVAPHDQFMTHLATEDGVIGVEKDGGTPA